MKKVVSVSLGPSELDCNFKSRFLGDNFQVTRTGTDGDAREVAKLIRHWRDNGWYWEYRGTPRLLPGGSEEDSLFQIDDLEMWDHHLAPPAHTKDWP